MNRTQFFLYAVIQSIRHPRSPVTYYYCPDCKLRFSPKETECPRCYKKVGHSVEVRQQPQIPWYGSVLLIIIGVACWLTGAVVEVPSLVEAGHALVYIPLGNLFGMALRS